MSDTTQQSVLFPELFSKPVHVGFSDEHLSTNGGLILLSAKDRQWGLSKSLCGVLEDKRQPGKVDHAFLDQLRQRVFGIAAGYADCNDAAKLREDPMLKLGCDRDPVNGKALASQPTLSRFENAVDSKQLLRMSMALARHVIGEQARRRQGARAVRRIVIDIDPTCDPTHGQQQLTMFNGLYDTHCYLPMVVTISFNQEKRKYPVAAILRAGTAGPMIGTLGMLRRLVTLLRTHFGSTRLYFRADSAFAVPELFDYLDGEQIRYAIGMGSNAVLERVSEALMEQARELAAHRERTATLYGEARYQSSGWDRERWASYKAQVVVNPDKEAPKDNPRYVINNLDARYSAHGAFNFYYGHSDMENTIKELKNDLSMDRTSCMRFLANQFRVLMTLAAYVLLQAVTEDTEDQDLRKATMATLRDRLLKIAVRVRSSVRRITLEFTFHHPWADEWLACARTLGAIPI